MGDRVRILAAFALGAALVLGGQVVASWLDDTEAIVQDEDDPSAEPTPPPEDTKEDTPNEEEPTAEPDPEPDERPNLLLIVSDDQRYDTMDAMPETVRRIFEEGITYERAYVTTPLCCPSRASILTGQFAHHHTVKRNQHELPGPTIANALQDAGYTTGLVGKYLNSWHGKPRPEYDVWVSFPFGASRYHDPLLITSDVAGEYSGYMTDLLTEAAVRFIDHAQAGDKPFFLLFAPNAPHPPTEPDPDDRDRFLDLPPHRPPSFNPTLLPGKPSWLSERAPLNESEIAEIDDVYVRHRQTLASLDRGIAQVLDALERHAILNETVIVYLSDNGVFFGEHRLIEKSAVYEEAVRVPMALRYPPLVPAPRIETRIVANIDVAPTLLEAAGVAPPVPPDGRSLFALERNEKWRDFLFLEAWPEDHPYQAIHTGRYVYVETYNDIEEFYDLETDPYQLDNRVEDPEYAETVALMREGLRRDAPPWVLHRTRVQ